MTKVRFFLSAQGIHGFEIKDHSGYADHGQDIVCAAISALGQTAVIGLTEVLGMDCSVDIRDAYLACYLPKEMAPAVWEHSQTLLQTLYRGLTAIQAEYPDYLRIREVEQR
ncbi:MAG TPA: ribosomal-processing cysteine protease Prp [Firmicutes bacterium]|mgnify:CR=1 FL=1|jgi:uncharacterized protein YsxB (DUF464 family)|nr:MAG: hypothetical protein AA931_00845 [Peptococcaceae bacterium 1109]HHT73474.1 ribosomal-processing cysteine protease Prp [Bacillota bacterium]